MRLVARKILKSNPVRWDLFVPPFNNFVAEGAVVHNCNCRVGMIEGQRMAGSHTHRRKEPVVCATDLLEASMFPSKMTGRTLKTSLFWFPWSMPEVEKMLTELGAKNKVVMLFGETFGQVQNLKYGRTGLDFRAFDLYVDGEYADYQDFQTICDMFGVKTVPIIGVEKFSLQRIAELSDGESLVIGANNIREGVVVRPVVERYNEEVGRVILKYVGASYLASKHHESDTKDA